MVIRQAVPRAELKVPGLVSLDTDLQPMGELVARDADSYRYLAESIRMHPDQETLKGMMEQAGFERCDVHNLTGGIVAVHRGFKL